MTALLEAEGRLPSGQVVDPLAPPPTPRRPTPSPPIAPVFESAITQALDTSASEPPPMPRRPSQSPPIIQPDLTPTASPLLETSAYSPPPPAYPDEKSSNSLHVEENEHQAQERAAVQEQEHSHEPDHSADEKAAVMPGAF